MPTTHALLYDTHHQRHLEDLPFWLELARNANGPILELGCGTGRILLPLLENNLPAIGLDLDADMLAILREKSRLTVCLWKPMLLIWRPSPTAADGMSQLLSSKRRESWPA